MNITPCRWTVRRSIYALCMGRGTRLHLSAARKAEVNLLYGEVRRGESSAQKKRGQEASLQRVSSCPQHGEVDEEQNF